MHNNLKILVSHYKDEQWTDANSWPREFFEPWDVRFNSKSKLLEFDLFKRMRSNRIIDTFKYSGLISHSAMGKLAMPIDYICDQIAEGIESEVDIITLNPAHACNAFFKNGIEQAQLIGQDKMMLLFKKLGFSDLVVQPLPYYSFVMCSYFIAKKDFWDYYFDCIEAVLSNAETLVHHDEVFRNAYYGDSNYKIKPGQFDYRPFIIERLLQIILSTKKFKIKYIEPEKLTYAIKFGYRAKLIYNMYQLKKLAFESKENENLWEELRAPFLLNNALLYKITSHGEFYRSNLQMQENMTYFHDGEFL